MSPNFITHCSWEFGYAIYLLFLCADLEIFSSTTASGFSRFSDSFQKLGCFTMALRLCCWASVDGKEMGASNELFMATWVMASTVSLAMYL